MRLRQQQRPARRGQEAGGRKAALRAMTGTGAGGQRQGQQGEGQQVRQGRQDAAQEQGQLIRNVSTVQLFTSTFQLEL